MALKYLKWLKNSAGEEIFKQVVKAAEDDIKFNRVGFNKTTTEDKFIEICMLCHTAILKTVWGGLYGEINRRTV